MTRDETIPIRYRYFYSILYRSSSIDTYSVSVKKYRYLLVSITFFFWNISLSNLILSVFGAPLLSDKINVDFKGISKRLFSHTKTSVFNFPFSRKIVNRFFLKTFQLILYSHINKQNRQFLKKIQTNFLQAF